MTPLHLPFWPKGLPQHLTVPETNLFYNAEVSAKRFPNKPYIVYYAILRANAVVVPISSMNLTEELRYLVSDSDAAVALVSQELYPRIQPLLGDGLRHAVVAAYSDYLGPPTDLPIPEVIAAPREPIRDSGVTLWSDAVKAGLSPGPVTVGPDDLCVMPYTSGTTDRPKGCMHTHRSAMYTAVAGVEWFGSNQDAVLLAVL